MLLVFNILDFIELLLLNNIFDIFLGKCRYNTLLKNVINFNN